MRRKVIALAEKHRPSVILIEEAGPGINLLQDLRGSAPKEMARPIGIKPDGPKLARMAAQSAQIESGCVWIPTSAPWVADLLHELLSFPYGRHDDQVDSVSQFLFWRQNDAYRFEAPFVSADIVRIINPGGFPW